MSIIIIGLFSGSLWQIADLDTDEQRPGDRGAEQGQHQGVGGREEACHDMMWAAIYRYAIAELETNIQNIIRNLTIKLV